MTGSWVILALLVFSLVDVLALTYVYRLRTSGGGDREHVQGDTVECPECGTANERGYRFCRRCVSKLPGQMSFLDESSSPQSRQTL